MPRKYNTEPGNFYFATVTVVGWIDVFTRKEYVYFLMDNLRYCQENKGLRLYAYVIMSNHFHIVARSESIPLNILLGQFKSYTCKQLVEMINDNPYESRKEWMMHMFRFFGRGNSQNEEFQFWQNGNHSVELCNSTIIGQKINYIHCNPVRQGIVTEPHNYVYSSANPGSGLTILEL